MAKDKYEKPAVTKIKKDADDQLTARKNVEAELKKRKEAEEVPKVETAKNVSKFKNDILSVRQKIALSQDTMDNPIVFFSDEKTKSVKIPMTKLGDNPLPTPLYAVFQDHKLSTNSRHVASVLRKKCSPTGIIESKG